MTGEQVLTEVLRHLAYTAQANAAMHCAPPKWSPLTFRVAEMIDASFDVSALSHHDVELLCRVMADRGRYAEDPGR